MTIPWLPATQTAHNPQAVARILKTLPLNGLDVKRPMQNTYMMLNDWKRGR